MKRKTTNTKEEKKDIKEPILLFLKGALMGLFDLVPGISGGTIALITNIYLTLIKEINNAYNFIKTIFEFNLKKTKKAWHEINKKFLITLILGIITGIIISVNLMSYFLENYFAQTLGAITGIILIASLIMIKQYAKDKKNILIGSAGLALGILISILTPLAGHSFNYAQIFILGAITITAMILPGISGALILLLLGGYAFMIDALRSITTEYLTVAIFILGAITGLGLFSYAINYLLKKHHDATMAFLAMLMLGAITKPILEILNAKRPELAIPFFAIAIIIAAIISKRK